MNAYGSRTGLDEYRQVGLDARVAEASPHELVQMMIDGALMRIASARAAIEANDVARKGELIGKAIGLVDGLRMSLDTERGGGLAENLEALYDYMSRRLLEANVHDSIRALDEVSGLLRELAEGWRELGELIARHDGEAPRAHA